MKILHIVPSIASIRGGPSLAVVEMVRALNKLGIQACIATANDNGDLLLDVPLNRWTEYEGIPVIFFPKLSISLRPIREFNFSNQLAHWLWENVANFDLVHVHGIFSFSSSAGMLISRLRKVPYIIAPHGMLTVWALQQESLKKKIYLSLVEKKNLNSSHRIHYTSEQEREEALPVGLSAPSFVQSLGLTIPETIPGARAELRTYLNLPADQTIILFLSRFHPKKGLNLTIPALAKLRDKEFTFLLVGQGTAEYEAEIQRLLEVCQLTSRTIRPGFATGRLKNLFLQGSDLFALNSYSENFGIASLEAMASGLPVITSPNVGFASMVQAQGFCLIAPQDVESIAEKISYALDHPGEMQEMAQRAKDYVIKNFTWDRVAEKLIQVYQQIIHHSDRGIL